MAFPATQAYLTSVVFLVAPPSALGASDRIAIGDFAIDRNEVTIGDFAAFAEATKLKTAAEQEGGGREWGSGWERRPGWTFRTPYGEPPLDRSNLPCTSAGTRQEATALGSAGACLRARNGGWQPTGNMAAGRQQASSRVLHISIRPALRLKGQIPTMMTLGRGMRHEEPPGRA